MGTPARHNNTNFVTFFKALAINAGCGAVAYWEYREGWIDAVLKADTVFISQTIFGLGLLGLVMVMWRIFNVSRELNITHKYYALAREKGAREAGFWLKSTKSLVAEFARRYREAKADDKPIIVDQLEKKMIRKFSYLAALEDWLVRLGLLGTVVGFRMGLSMIDFEAFRNFELFGSFLSKLTGSFFIALDTTIVGICMAIWLDINLKWILRPAMGQVIEEAVNIGVSYE